MTSLFLVLQNQQVYLGGPLQFVLWVVVTHLMLVVWSSFFRASGAPSVMISGVILTHRYVH